MKSAYERALERFGDEPVQRLSDEQKVELAKVDKIYEARIAEARLLAKDKMKKADSADKKQELREHLAADVARLEDRREREKDKIRNAE